MAPDPTAGVASLGAASRADLLRRELDSRFLSSQERGGAVGGPPSGPNGTGAAGLIPQPYLHTEMHHHQHQHTHIHQHNSSPSSTSSSTTMGSQPLPTSSAPSLGAPSIHSSMLPPLPGAGPPLLPPTGASPFLSNPMVSSLNFKTWSLSILGYKN